MMRASAGHQRTYIDLVQRHIECLGETFLRIGAGLALCLKMGLQDIMLLLGQTGYNIAAHLRRHGLARIGAVVEKWLWLL